MGNRPSPRHVCYQLPQLFDHNFIFRLRNHYDFGFGWLGELAELGRLRRPMGTLAIFITRTISMVMACPSLIMHFSRLNSEVIRGWVISLRRSRPATGIDTLNWSHNCRLVMNQSCCSAQAATSSKSSSVDILSLSSKKRLASLSLSLLPTLPLADY